MVGLYLLAPAKVSLSVQPVRSRLATGAESVVVWLL